ncbi:MAG: hypothetical protein JW818_03195 [Pirellulales bacterium]|nr:hypothetical protein [Pirellulales bacterium]
MPTSVGDGPLTVVAVQDLGARRILRSRPVDVPWRWYDGMPGVLVWIALLGLGFGLRDNRRDRAWLFVLVPLGLTLFWLGATPALIGPFDGGRALLLWLDGIAFMSISMSLLGTAVLLSRSWLFTEGRFDPRRLLLVLFVAVMLLAQSGYIGLSRSETSTGPSPAAWGAAAILLAVATWLIAYRFSQATSEQKRLLGWPAVQLLLVSVVCVVLFVTLPQFRVQWQDANNAGDTIGLLLRTVSGVVLLPLALCIVNLPFTWFCLTVLGLAGGWGSSLAPDESEPLEVGWSNTPREPPFSG